MDQKIRSIEKLLFVPYQRHTAFNGQISIGVGLRFCAREFSPSGDKPPPAGAACSIGLLNAHIQKAADFVFRYKVGRFHLRLPEQRVTVTTCNVKGERVTIKKDKAKNKSSLRTYPLIPFLKERLLEAKKQQEENRKLCGRSYNKEYLGYVCVDVIGNLIKPNYVSSTFGKLLAKNNLRHIRFHDLRHPYVKHTTKKYNSEKQKTQTIREST